MLKLLKKLMGRKRQRSILIFVLFTRLARPQEKSVWENVTVLDMGNQSTSFSPKENLVDATFKESF